MSGHLYTANCRMTRRAQIEVMYYSALAVGSAAQLASTC